MSSRVNNPQTHGTEAVMTAQQRDDLAQRVEAWRQKWLAWYQREGKQVPSMLGELHAVLQQPAAVAPDTPEQKLDAYHQQHCLGADPDGTPHRCVCPDVAPDAELRKLQEQYDREQGMPDAGTRQPDETCEHCGESVIDGRCHCNSHLPDTGTRQPDAEMRDQLQAAMEQSRDRPAWAKRRMPAIDAEEHPAVYWHHVARTRAHAAEKRLAELRQQLQELCDDLSSHAHSWEVAADDKGEEGAYHRGYAVGVKSANARVRALLAAESGVREP